MIKWEDYFYYDETSYSCLRWKVDIRTGKEGRVLLVSAGDVAGCTDSDGYYRGQCNGKFYKTHRVIWELHNGPIPEDKVVDHINGLRHDNRICNLRVVPISCNSQNMAMSSRNTSGKVGVVHSTQTNRYGKVYDYWTAYWVSGKKLKSKAFSFLKHGSEEAKRLATEYREAMITQLNSAGADYTDRHGTKEN